MRAARRTTHSVGSFFRTPAKQSFDKGGIGRYSRKKRTSYIVLVLGEAKGVSASGRVCTKSVQVFAYILRFVLLQTRTPSHSTSQPRNTREPRGPCPSTVKSSVPRHFFSFALRPALTHEVATRPSPELAWLSPWLEFWGEPLPAIASPARSCP